MMLHRLAGPRQQACPRTDKIVRAAIQVHNWLGPGPLLGAYREALTFEFTLLGIGFWRAPFGASHQADFLCAPGVVVHVVDLASVEPSDEADLREALDAVNLDLALLLDFGRQTLQVRRIPRQA